MRYEGVVHVTQQTTGRRWQYQCLECGKTVPQFQQRRVAEAWGEKHLLDCRAITQVYEDDVWKVKCMPCKRVFFRGTARLAAKCRQTHETMHHNGYERKGNDDDRRASRAARQQRPVREREVSVQHPG